MWILPNNHPLSSAFAQEYVESKEDLKEYFDQSEPVLMWKSKPLSWKTFLLQWKKAWWMQHLSGRILKPSTRNHFEKKLMESLEDIRVSHSPWRVNEKERMTRGTYGPSFGNTLEPYNPDGVSLRTSPATLRSDSTWLKQNWKKWVTSLRQESTQRRKSARLIAENGCSSLPLDWSTPTAQEQSDVTPEQAEKLGWVWGGTAYYTPEGVEKNTSLTHQVHTWPTPQNRDYRSPDLKGSGNMNRKIEKRWAVDLNSAVLLNWPTPTTTDSMEPKTEKALLKEATETRPGRTSFSNLRDAVVTGPMKSWPTPVAHETRLGYQDRSNGMKGSQESLTTTVLNTDFPQVKEYISTHGKSPARLNPAWSIQLMGTTLQRIFTVPLAIRWLNRPPSSLSETSGEKPQTGTNSLTDDWLYG